VNGSAVAHFFGFTGRPFDADADLQWNLHRWYDPQTGRWLTEDPLGFAAGDENLYRYVGNSVLNAIDPDGLEKVIKRCEYDDGSCELLIENDSGQCYWVKKGPEASRAWRFVRWVGHILAVGDYCRELGRGMELDAKIRELACKRILAGDCSKATQLRARSPGDTEIAAMRLVARAGVEITAGVAMSAGAAPRWGSWGLLPKVSRAGREYANIGGRLYTEHAIAHMAPRGLGRTPGVAGEVLEARGIPPMVVEEVIRHGRIVETRAVGLATRVSKILGDVLVVLEDDIVVTVGRR